jgi:hypothetical protein
MRIQAVAARGADGVNLSTRKRPSCISSRLDEVCLFYSPLKKKGRKPRSAQDDFFSFFKLEEHAFKLTLF